MEDMQGMLDMQHMAHMECFRGGGLQEDRGMRRATRRAIM